MAMWLYLCRGLPLYETRVANKRHTLPTSTSNPLRLTMQGGCPANPARQDASGFSGPR